MPPREMRTLLRWLGVAALAIIVFNLFVAKAYGQKITMVDDLDGYLGITRCDSVNNVPVISILSGQSQMGTRMTILHEQVHARQLQNAPGGCNAGIKRYQQDEVFRFKMEAEAYCIETDFEINLDKREYMLDELALKLFKMYSEQMLYVQSKKIVYDICNDQRGSHAPP